MGIIEKWTEVLTKPEKALKAAKGKGDLMDGIKAYAIAGLLVGLVAGIIAFLVAVMVAAFAGPIAAVVGIGAAIAILIGYTVGYVVGALVIHFIAYLIATAGFNGKGKFDNQVYLGSIWAMPFAVLNMLIIVVGIIPVLGWVLSPLLGLALFVYGVYLLYLTVKVAHNL